MRRVFGDRDSPGGKDKFRGAVPYDSYKTEFTFAAEKPKKLVAFSWQNHLETEKKMTTNLTLSTADAVVLAVIAVLMVVAVRVIIGFFKDKK